MSDYQYQHPYPAQPYQQAAPVIDANYVAYLEQRVRVLEAKVSGALVSGGFLKKSFAVWGYAFVANFIISVIVGVLSFIVSLVFGAALWGTISSALEQSGGAGF